MQSQSEVNPKAGPQTAGGKVQPKSKTLRKRPRSKQDQKVGSEHADKDGKKTTSKTMKELIQSLRWTLRDIPKITPSQPEVNMKEPEVRRPKPDRRRRPSQPEVNREVGNRRPSQPEVNPKVAPEWRRPRQAKTTTDDPTSM